MTIAHHELNTSDLAGAKKFYGAVFGWTFEDMPMGDGTVYSIVKTKEGVGFGGFQQHPMPGAPSAWLNYASVGSLGKTLGKIEKNGGTVLVPATVIPNMGSFAVFQDPQGAAFAIWEAAPPPPKPEKAEKAEKAEKKKDEKKKPKKDKKAKKDEKSGKKKGDKKK